MTSLIAHMVVNHSIHFVNPVTGVHTNSVESYWNRVKRKLKHMKGCHRHQLPLYLDEFMWMEPAGEEQMHLNNMCANISTQYPV